MIQSKRKDIEPINNQNKTASYPVDNNKGDISEEKLKEYDKRNELVVSRLNRETGNFDDITFKRGETVKFYMGKKDGKSQFSTGVIEGIRHKKNGLGKEQTYIMSGGIEFDEGFVYKQDDPIELFPKEVKKENLSSVIDKINKINETTFTETDKVLTEIPTKEVKTYNNVLNTLKDLRRGNANSLKTVKNVYDYLNIHEQDIKSEAKKLKVSELQKLVGGAYVRDYKKPQLIDKYYEEMYADLYYAITGENTITLSFGKEKIIDQYKAKISNALESLTEEELSNRLVNRKTAVDKRMAERKALIEGIKAPKTLEDFENAKRVRELSVEEQRAYDELKALDIKEKVKEKQVKEEVRKAEVSAIQDGELPANTIEKTKHTKTGEEIGRASCRERVFLTV